MTSITVAASRSYQVHIAPGLLCRVGELCAPMLEGRDMVIVSDSNVWPIYGQRVKLSLEEAGFQVCHFIFSAGEQSKSPQTLIQLLTFLAQQGISRADGVVALGGGVTGDLTGLAASLYQRGIPCIQLPTTLLAAVDSSVGGKTAVDLPQGKNLIGTFTQPHMVLCDTQALATLPPAAMAEGWAEVIKYGMIASPQLLDFLWQQPPGTDLEWIIAHCLSIKREVVAADEYDNGQRQLLNFGHTIGHAIERCADYRIHHGEGVAIGMAIMTRACVKLGRCPAQCGQLLEQLLKKYGLPNNIAIDKKALLQAAQADKKRRGRIITLIEPSGLGQCVLHKADDQQLAEILDLGVLT